MSYESWPGKAAHDPRLPVVDWARISETSDFPMLGLPGLNYFILLSVCC